MQFDNKFFRVLRTCKAAIFFFIVSVFLIFFGVILAANSNDSSLEETTATIVDIKTSVEDGESVESVYVDYSVDGVNYTNIPLNSYNSSMKIGSTVTIYYDPSNPGVIVNKSGILPVIFIGLGVITLVGTVIFTVNRVKKSKKLDQQEAQFKRDIESAKNNEFDPNYEPTEKTENEQKYYCLLDKHMKQGLYWEDESRKVVYEARMDQLKLVGNTPFTFVNHLTGKTEEHQVGHTVTSNEDDMVSESYFKFDGENVWDYLHEKGIRIKTELGSHIIDSNYHIYYRGEEIAFVKSCGPKVHEEDAKGIMNVLPVKGFYRISTHEVDLDLLFLVVFAIARTDQGIYE